jgi:hypothetical protein
MAQAPQMPTNADVFARRAQRREALANAMLQQSLTPTQGQQTWLSPIQKIVEAFMASRLQKRADKDYQQFVDTKKEITGRELEEYFKRTGGDGLAPNTPEMLISRFGNATSPVVQAMLAKEIELGAKRKEQDFTLKDTINDRDPETGQPRQMGVYQSGRVAALPGLGAPLAPLTFQGQVGLDQFTGKPIAQAPADPEAIAIRGELKPGQVFGDIIPNPVALAGKSQLAAAGKPVTNVIMPSETSYSKTFGEGVAKADLETITAARNAPQVIQQANLVKNLLKRRPITGTFADQMLWVNKALATAGMIDPQQVQDTEVLKTTLTRMTLANVRAANLGAGNGFSNTDRDFVEKASGQLSMTPATLERLADIAIRTARLAEARGKAIERRAGGIPGTGAVPLSSSSVDPRGLSPEEQSLLDKYR